MVQLAKIVKLSDKICIFADGYAKHIVCLHHPGKAHGFMPLNRYDRKIKSYGRYNIRNRIFL